MAATLPMSSTTCPATIVGARMRGGGCAKDGDQQVSGRRRDQVGRDFGNNGAEKLPAYNTSTDAFLYRPGVTGLSDPDGQTGQRMASSVTLGARLSEVQP